jgi:hypothetical protein
MTTIQKLSAINNTLAPGPSKDVNRADIKTVLVSNGALCRDVQVGVASRHDPRTAGAGV